MRRVIVVLASEVLAYLAVVSLGFNNNLFVFAAVNSTLVVVGLILLNINKDKGVYNNNPLDSDMDYMKDEELREKLKSIFENSIRLNNALTNIKTGYQLFF